MGASDVPNIIRRTKTGYSASRANLMALKVLERLTGLPAETYQSAAMTAGLEREPLARAAYGFMHDVTVEPVRAGVVRHPLIEGAHACRMERSECLGWWRSSARSLRRISTRC